ncbi:MAG: SPOR domain-containing protein [Gammaproteobacteria bacterium]|jgi:DedD protein|nr:SPOR domain-containing protein [Gammaproteobacteria bacterium]
METRIKERLTGAIVLVAVVVLVVPALLSGPRQHTRAPEAGEGPTREMVIDLASRKPARPEDPDEPQAEPTPRAGQVLVAPSGIPEVAGEPMALAPEATPPAAAASPAVGPTEAPPPAATAPVAVPAPRAAVQQPAAAPPPVTAWAVQLGAFATQATAQKLVNDLKGRGYSAFWLEYRSGGKVLYRVRVGPEQARERAVAVAARLKGEGYDLASVAPHP